MNIHHNTARGAQTLLCEQFFFDASGVGAPMRSWLCVQLGTWHPYKQANTVVWTHWAERVFGPLFNELIPNANFNKKAGLATVASFLTFVRLAYPSFQSELQAAIERVRANDQDVIAMSHLRDIKKLVEFFIPAVRLQSSTNAMSETVGVRESLCVVMGHSFGQTLVL